MAFKDRSWSRDLQKTKTVGRAYLDGAKKRSTWLNFHHGMAAVHEMNAELHEASIINALTTNFPDPETTREVCSTQVLPDIARANEMRKEGTPEGRKASRDLLNEWVPDTRNKATVLKAVCAAANDWDRVERHITRCPTPEEDMTPVCCAAGKGLKRHNPDSPCDGTVGMEDCSKVTGLGMKGTDMAMLLQGCEVPVPDKWMLWHMSETAEPEIGRLPRPGTRVGNTDGKSILDYHTSKIQDDPKRYAKYRQAIINEAREQGLTVGEFHTGVWLDLVTCQQADPDTGECLVGGEGRAFRLLGDLFD